MRYAITIVDDLLMPAMVNAQQLLKNEFTLSVGFTLLSNLHGNEPALFLHHQEPGIVVAKNPPPPSPPESYHNVPGHRCRTQQNV
eukprot:1700099-Amphidinium_carterae.3